VDTEPSSSRGSDDETIQAPAHLEICQSGLPPQNLWGSSIPADLKASCRQGRPFAIIGPCRDAQARCAGVRFQRDRRYSHQQERVSFQRERRQRSGRLQQRRYVMPLHEPDAREALRKIAEIAAAAINNDEESAGRHSGRNGGSSDVDEATAQYHAEAVCTPKILPKRLLHKAAETAVHLNPVNAPIFAQAGAYGAAVPSDPLFIAVITSKYWGSQPRRFTVSFMETTPADLRARIVSHMNAWANTAGVSFVETQRDGQVRISRQSGGYWSYLGTDVLLIPKNRQTMNLQGFTMNTPESEYRRVVRHETGHTLGFPHEHMRKALVDRIDPKKAYDYFLRTQGWNKQTVDQQVLTALDERSLMSTPPDQTSIMCYQLPGSITRDGRPILGGVDINATDSSFAARIYPKPGLVASTTASAADEWSESEDVDVDVTDLQAAFG
jgi:hypothetical protein